MQRLDLPPHTCHSRAQVRAGSLRVACAATLAVQRQRSIEPAQDEPTVVTAIFQVHLHMGFRLLTPPSCIAAGREVVDQHLHSELLQCICTPHEAAAYMTGDLTP